MSETGHLEAMAELLRVLGHGVRLSLLACLRDGERSVTEIERHTGVGQPGLSQQLGILRRAGLVQTRRDAKLVLYRLDTAQLDMARAWLDGLSGETPPGLAAATPHIAKGRQASGTAAAFARIILPAQPVG